LCDKSPPLSAILQATSDCLAAHTGAALLLLGLDTRHETAYGRTRQE
jgi:hypothetical protein